MEHFFRFLVGNDFVDGIHELPPKILYNKFIQKIIKSVLICFDNCPWVKILPAIFPADFAILWVPLLFPLRRFSLLPIILHCLSPLVNNKICYHRHNQTFWLFFYFVQQIYVAGGIITLSKSHSLEGLGNVLCPAIIIMQRFSRRSID